MISKNDPDRFIVQITTSGKAPDSVSNIIDEMKKFQLDFDYEVWVVTEEDDQNQYNADHIIHVPREYTTKNDSKYKTRALCYTKEIRAKLSQIGEDVKILFLDDDSLPTQEYMSAAYHSNYDIAQGIVSPRRHYGVSILPSIQDSIRTSDCVALCSHFNSIGDARIIHGEGLVVRANVEQDIGWDYGDCLAEDLVFGRHATRKYRFGFIPEYITIAPPKSIRDFMKQRRRWFWGQIKAFKLVDRSHKLFMTARYFTAILGAFSYIFVLLDQLLTLDFSPTLRWLFILNTMGWTLYYAIGNYLNLRSLKWVIYTIALAFPAGFLESIALIYSVFTRPTGFDVIEK